MEYQRYKQRKRQWAFFDSSNTKTVSCLCSHFIFAIYCRGADKRKWQAPYKWKMVEILALVVSSRSYNEKVLPILSTRYVWACGLGGTDMCHAGTIVLWENSMAVSSYTHMGTHTHITSVWYPLQRAYCLLYMRWGTFCWVTVPGDVPSLEVYKVKLHGALGSLIW